MTDTPTSQGNETPPRPELDPTQPETSAARQAEWDRTYGGGHAPSTPASPPVVAPVAAPGEEPNVAASHETPPEAIAPAPTAPAPGVPPVAPPPPVETGQAPPPPPAQ